MADLIKDLGTALKPYGIRLIVYLPSKGPGRDLPAMAKLGLGNSTSRVPGHQTAGSDSLYKMYSMLSGAGAGSRQVPGKRQVASEGGYLWGTAPDGRRFVEFQCLLRQAFLLILSAFRSTEMFWSRYNWEAVIREWSLRWGDLVDGWWFDGCYAPIEMYTYETAPNFGTWAAAARAGNNASILTFSYGEMAYGQSVTVESDYVDGDSRTEVLKINPSVPGHQGYSQWNEQQHLVTFLGIGWGVETTDPNPRFTDEQVINLTKKFNDGNWTITWDCPITDNGRLVAPVKAQLEKLKPLMKDRPPLTSTPSATAFPASDSLPMIAAKKRRTQWFYNAVKE